MAVCVAAFVLTVVDAAVDAAVDASGVAGVVVHTLTAAKLFYTREIRQMIKKNHK